MPSGSDAGGAFRLYGVPESHAQGEKHGSGEASRLALQLKGHGLEDGHQDKEPKDPDEDVEPLRAGARMTLCSPRPNFEQCHAVPSSRPLALHAAGGET